MKINFIDQHGVFYRDYDYSKALRISRELDFDLVKVTTGGTCIYKLVRLTAARTAITVNRVKYLTLKTRIFKNDYINLLAKIRRLLLKGFLVKVTIRQLGREISKVDIMRAFSGTFIADVSKFAIVLKQTLIHPGCFSIMLKVK
ncbi:hypothetical protein JSR02_00460 [Candidatus Vidania fulgoroideae]|uniref:Uncharacterized protein n=1 Tax=Candidatus Vidania fulgoroideorum TaxID=881286 RepID=A0A975ADZ2_9PROT|nr:hypothetical protein JSR02_00460 [Candidatus Vidania fulgoroideae]